MAICEVMNIDCKDNGSELAYKYYFYNHSIASLIPISLFGFSEKMIFLIRT